MAIAKPWVTDRAKRPTPKGWPYVGVRIGPPLRGLHFSADRYPGLRGWRPTGCKTAPPWADAGSPLRGFMTAVLPTLLSAPTFCGAQDAARSRYLPDSSPQRGGAKSAQGAAMAVREDGHRETLGYRPSQTANPAGVALRWRPHGTTPSGFMFLCVQGTQGCAVSGLPAARPLHPGLTQAHPCGVS